MKLVGVWRGEVKSCCTQSAAPDQHSCSNWLISRCSWPSGGGQVNLSLLQIPVYDPHVTSSSLWSSRLTENRLVTLLSPPCRGVLAAGPTLKARLHSAWAFMLFVKNNMKLHVWVIFLQHLKQVKSKDAAMEWSSGSNIYSSLQTPRLPF